MSIGSGYSNQKKIGPVQYKTVHNVGSDKYASNVVTKGLIENQLSNIAITAVTTEVDSAKNLRLIYLEIIGHGLSLSGGVIRFYTGDLATVEADVYEILDDNTLVILDVFGILPVIGDEVRTAYYRTPQFDVNGNVVVSSGPTQFVKNGVPVEVEEDDVDPSNNAPLPTGLYIRKETDVLPVTDSVTPANVVAIPVKIMAVDGTNINITAGDINIQTTDMGPSFDSMRIGDGSGNYIGVNASTEALVHDADVLTQLTTLNTVDFSTEAKQDSIITELQTLNGIDFATEAKQDSQITELQGISGKLPATLGQKTSAQSLAVVLPSDQTVNIDTTGLATEAKQDSIITELTTLNTVDFATEAKQDGIISALTNILANTPTLGQKASVGSAPVVLSTEQESILERIADASETAPAVPAALPVKQAALTVGLAAVRLTTDAAAPSASRRKLQFIIEPPAGDVNYFVGSSTVTPAGATRGIRVYAGTLYTYDNDAGDYYIISDTAAQTVFVMEQE